MKIVRIFESQNCLFSIKFDNEEFDEFERLFDLWNDTEYLYNFFDENQKYLKDSYWVNQDIDTIVLKTREFAGKFENKILEFQSVSDDQQQKFLESIFEPLTISNYKDTYLTKSKSKESWLRIYALKINKNAFIITGGAIKLTKEMKDHEATKNELKKLEQCRNYLKNNGITDIEQIEFILKEY